MNGERTNDHGHLVNGVVVGEVTSVDDPDDEGRIEIRFPWMEGNNQSYWAPPATLMSGGERGSWFMPEVGDEVLVAFDHGRFEHPFIVGFLWNGASRPPNADIDPSVRRLQTVSGHRIDFDDRDASKRVLIHSSGGHEVLLEDAENQKIDVKTNGGHELNLDDTGGKVELKHSGGPHVTLQGTSAVVEASGNTMTLDGAGGTVTLKSTSGMSITIDSMGQVKIDAPLGVQVQTLKAEFTGIVEAKWIKAKLAEFQLVNAEAIIPTTGNFIGL